MLRTFTVNISGFPKFTSVDQPKVNKEKTCISQYANLRRQKDVDQPVHQLNMFAACKVKTEVFLYPPF